MSKKYNLTTIVLLSFFYITYAHATDVSSWAELNDAVGDETITFTSDITATGTPTTIQLNYASPQIIDGGGFSLTGANNFQIKKVAGTDLTIQNFGSVIDADESDYTFSYIDDEENIIYKKITGSVSGFNKNPFIANNSLLTNLSISNSVFQNNTNEIINFRLNSADSEAFITNTVFYGNTLAVDDHAILTLGSGIVTLDNVVFHSNTTEEFAIGIDVAGATVNINNSIIQNNKKGYFGAVQVTSGTLNIDNSQFINNETYCDGGAISVSKGLNRVTNSIFKGNKAGNWGNEGGGAILYEQLASSPVFINDIFEDNQTSGPVGGGALFMSGTSVSTGAFTIIDSTFRHNIVTKANGLGGGMVAADLTDLFIINNNFVENSASFGGGLFTQTQPSYIVDTDFTNNTASEGGAIYSGNAILDIYAKDKNVIFANNTANNTTEEYNGGAAVYFEDSDENTDVEMNVNAASGRKVIFDNSIAAAGDNVVLNINKSDLSYTMYDDTVVNIANGGEIQFNDKVGDESGNIFNINLYGGTLSIGQNATLNAGFTDPDALINNNNFSVLGASTLNTANGIIGEFAPATFSIDADLSYQLDIDLDNGLSDTIVGANITENGSLTLTSLNIISDADVNGLQITYSGTNIGGTLHDNYNITTSTSNYNVSTLNDDSGSHLVFTKTAELGGLASAIKNGSDSYSITSESDEIITAWDTTNALSTDLIINGNNYAILTENDLDGIDVGDGYTLTINNISDISGFNYAISNEGIVELTNTTISDSIVNNGTMEINNNVALGTVSGNGTTNINANYELHNEFSGNTLNVKNSTLSGVNYLTSDVDLNVIGGTLAIDNQAISVQSANFDANSILSLTINSLSDYGSLTAENITVDNGAELHATLAQGLITNGDTASVQLLSANNINFNNFQDVFDNNMYHFEKADQNGLYNITLVNSAGDVVEQSGASKWVIDAATSYIDSNNFEDGSVGADIANKLANLAQNDSAELINAVKTLAPIETLAAQQQTVNDVDHLFNHVNNYLRGEHTTMGVSGGDTLEGFGLWIKPYVSKSKLHANGDISGFTSDSYGAVFGVEQKMSKSLKLGAGVQYDNSDIDALNRGMEIDTTVGFLYAEYKPTKWFINAILSYGTSDYKEEKYTLGSRYTADYDMQVLSVSAITGYQFKYISPEIGMRYYKIDRNEYTDSAMQTIGKLDTDILRSVAGLHLTKTFGFITPDVHVGLTYDINKPEHNTIVNLSNGTMYVVDGVELSRLGCELDVGFNAMLTDNLVFGINYTGSYHKNYEEHSGMLRLKYNF